MSPQRCPRNHPVIPEMVYSPHAEREPNQHRAYWFYPSFRELLVAKSSLYSLSFFHFHCLEKVTFRLPPDCQEYLPLFKQPFIRDQIHFKMLLWHPCSRRKGRRISTGQVRGLEAGPALRSQAGGHPLECLRMVGALHIQWGSRGGFPDLQASPVDLYLGFLSSSFFQGSTCVIRRTLHLPPFALMSSRLWTRRDFRNHLGQPPGRERTHGHTARIL